jgi:hypothetical protein
MPSILKVSSLDDLKVFFIHGLIIN